MATDLHPLFSRVLIKPTEKPKQVGSIIIPENSKEMEITEGEVIAIGPMVDSVQVGDLVYYGRYAGFLLERNGETLRFMNEEDLVSTIGGSNG